MLHQPPDALIQAPYGVGVVLFDGVLAVMGLLGVPAEHVACGDTMGRVAVDVGGCISYSYVPAPIAVNHRSR